MAALRSLGVLDTPREPVFDEIVALVAEICEAPIAVVNLIDEHRQWFKAEIGLGVRETPLESSICAHVILQPGLTVIQDTLADSRLCDNNLCIDTPGLRFYAGMCLETPDGLPIGTLCVLDTRPRDLTPRQRRFLSVLGRQVMSQIKLAHQLRQEELLRQEVDHRVKNSLSVVQSVLALQARQSTDPGVVAALRTARDRVAAVAQVHDEINRSGRDAQVDVKAFLERLSAMLATQAGDRITLSCNVPSAILRAGEAANVGLIINELVTNALQHGIGPDATGSIRIEGAFQDDRLRLSVTDDGKGLPAGFDPAQSSGLGMRLAMALAAGFGQPLQWSDARPGTRFMFDLPSADGAPEQAAAT